MRMRDAAHLLLAALAAAVLAGCSGTPPGTSPTGPSPGGTSPTSSAAPSPSVPISPAPTHTAPPTAGKGDAELSILVRASESAAPDSFTLVCKDGTPAEGTQHPTPEAACAALKAEPGIVIRAPRPTDLVCTMQYGGPQTAMVSGAIDGRGFESAFSLKDGCEISAWNAARDVLGSTGGAF